MAKPSVSIPDELLEEFDERIDEMRLSGELDLDTTRSEVVQELIRQWLEGNSSSTSGRSNQTATAD
jgi:metal-responsive CopG/Arc/MetJ family transcriptional regulator